MKITIPTADRLRNRLEGVDRLLTATTWERAAIVYAFTEPGNARNSNPPKPPKMTLAAFARQGFAGLSSVRTVERYRLAWTDAIEAGWVGEVKPGQEVELPDQPFPPWPYGADQPAAAIPDAPRGRGPNKPFTARAVVILESAANSLRQLAAMEFTSDDLEPEDRDQLVESLRLVRDRADEALRSLQGVPAGASWDYLPGGGRVEYTA